MKTEKQVNDGVKPELNESEVEKAQDLSQSTLITPPVEKPKHPHADLDYSYNDMRRCHLCGQRSEHMSHEAPGIWFASLEDRAKHIIECHKNYQWEVIRAMEILGMEIPEQSEDAPPIPAQISQQQDQQVPVGTYEQYFGQRPTETTDGLPQPKPKTKTKWNLKRILVIVVVVAVGYLIYVGYLTTLGYTF